MSWLPDGRSLYDLFGIGFTLLVAQGANESEVQKAVVQAEALHVPLDVVKPEGVDIAALYGADLTLIRPDQHVEWRGGQNGRASCRERVCRYVLIPGVAVNIK